MKIATIIGARPQFIKAAMVSLKLRVRQGVREILVHTGQHFDDNMSETFFEQMEGKRQNGLNWLRPESTFLSGLIRARSWRASTG